MKLFLITFMLLFATVSGAVNHDTSTVHKHLNHLNTNGMLFKSDTIMFIDSSRISGSIFAADCSVKISSDEKTINLKVNELVTAFTVVSAETKMDKQGENVRVYTLSDDHKVHLAVAGKNWVYFVGDTGEIMVIENKK